MSNTLKSDSINSKQLHEYMEFLEGRHKIKVSYREFAQDIQKQLAEIIHDDCSKREIEAIHDNFQESYYEAVEELEKIDEWIRQNGWDPEYQKKQNYWLKRFVMYRDLTTAAAFALGYGPGPYRHRDREKPIRT